ncbi:CDI toxin immunity protein [Bacillus pumilus]|uniref:CDI toxin immunity protein n=1 Tax=Bacillus pumilus TaxID=1408 RepID=UPI00352CBBBE
MSLLDECIEALGEGARVLYDNDRAQILSNLENHFPFYCYGQIEWEKVSAYAEVDTFNEIRSFLYQKMDEYSDIVYVIWDEGTLPIIQFTLDKVFEAIDDVTAVSFDTWIFFPSSGYVIEIFHDGEVKVGLK